MNRKNRDFYTIRDWQKKVIVYNVYCLLGGLCPKSLFCLFIGDGSSYQVHRWLENKLIKKDPGKVNLRRYENETNNNG